MSGTDGGRHFLEELRAFLVFLQSLWGILTGISIFFPLSNEFFKVIPLELASEDGAFFYVSPRLITAFATLVTLFVFLSTFSNRGSRSRLSRRAWVSFIVGGVAVLAYLGTYAIKVQIYDLAGWESDDPRHLLLELPLLLLYSTFFALVTRAFVLLGLLEFYRQAE